MKDLKKIRDSIEKFKLILLSLVGQKFSIVKIKYSLKSTVDVRARSFVSLL